MNHHYMQRARAAHAAAEAATDPRDKAAYLGAARTWERLAKPSQESAFSMRPYALQLAQLKRDAAEAASVTPAPLFADRDAHAEIPPGHEKRVTTVATARHYTREAVTIDF